MLPFELPAGPLSSCACMRACACERARAFARVRACAVVKPYPSGPIPDVLARPFICGKLRGVLIILLQSIKKSSDINHTHSKSNSTNSTSCMVSPAQLTKYMETSRRQHIASGYQWLRRQHMASGLHMASDTVGIKERSQISPSTPRTTSQCPT